MNAGAALKGPASAAISGIGLRRLQRWREEEDEFIRPDAPSPPSSASRAGSAAGPGSAAHHFPAAAFSASLKLSVPS